MPNVVDHFMPADVSAIKQESNILKDCRIHFINYGTHSKQEMEALVRKLGGTVSNCCTSCCMNYCTSAASTAASCTGPHTAASVPTIER